MAKHGPYSIFFVLFKLIFYWFMGVGGGGVIWNLGGGEFQVVKFNFQDLNLMQNFTAIPNPASFFGYNHLSQSFSALRNAMIETLKMPKMAKLPRLNSANDAQIRKKFRFVQEIGPRSWPVRKSKMCPPPDPLKE